ncbi:MULTISPECIES: hypothetical protein [Streptomyces]|uniref:hypothetical protein n=1 Tax=Streptomyces TaxID=1883 RepID=UPI0016745223|nr:MULTISPECIES: hypothetical protein [Streptomyces]MBK3524876.1 hypothetical protein [Streptomyces sp. MBT70]GGR70777.1 hypothetical protein GCM10010236_26230 [Streptomyces eurythermus]
MSDSITVRVMLGSYDIVHPAERQTQVYVQIPEVGRAVWLLDEEMYHVLKDRPWPSVVDSAEECYVRRGTVSDPVSAASRAAVMAWLRDDVNHDEMYVAWEQDQARQHPVARRLLAENERLRGQVAGEELAYERLRVALESAKRGRREARARIAELGTQDERRRARLAAAESDLLAVRGLLSPAGGARRVPAEVEIHERVAPAVEWLLNRVAALEAARGRVYRASHDSIVMGLYTTAAEARKHCVTEMLREYDESTKVSLWWSEDEDTVDKPEDGEQELFAHVTPRGFDRGRTWRTGYVVTPLEVASEYDEGADE